MRPATLSAGRTWFRRRLTPVLLLTAIACKDDGTGPGDRVVEGVDLAVLFAEPSPAEVSAIAAEWAGRVPDAQDVVIEKDSIATAGSLSMRVRVVSHDVGGLTHYGAVLTEEGLAADAPVLVYAHGGDGGAGIDDLLFLLPFAGDLATEFVWVVPSFRSEALTWGDSTWTSDGPPSPWDRDVDDALALLEVTLQIEALADADRVGVLGFSRGAGVGLLMGARDPRIDRIVEFFGPTDFFGVYVQDVVEEALRGFPRELPGLDYLNATFIQPFKNGELGLDEIRSELVRRSAVLYGDRLPAVQIHHGTDDMIVEVSQAESLIEVLEGLGRTEPDFQAYLYPGGTHDPLSLSGSVPRAVDFLDELLPVTVP